MVEGVLGIFIPFPQHLSSLTMGNQPDFILQRFSVEYTTPRASVKYSDFGGAGLFLSRGSRGSVHPYTWSSSIEQLICQFLLLDRLPSLRLPQIKQGRVWARDKFICTGEPFYSFKGQEREHPVLANLSDPSFLNLFPYHREAEQRLHSPSPCMGEGLGC